MLIQLNQLKLIQNQIQPGSLQSFKHVSFLILDEIHCSNAGLLEEIIILLPKHIRLLALSSLLIELDAFRKWLERALAAGKPAIIECRVDPEALTPRQTMSQIRQAGGTK